MLSHVTVGTNDIDRAVRFYDAALAPLGIKRGESPWPTWAMWRVPGEYYPMLWVGQPFDLSRAENGNGWMAAFLCETKEAVRAAVAAGLLWSLCARSRRQQGSLHLAERGLARTAAGPFRDGLKAVPAPAAPDRSSRAGWRMRVRGW